MLPCLSLVKPNNDIALYVILAVLGGASLTLLPVVLELSVELTRNAEGSSAVLWFACVPYSFGSAPALPG